MNYIKALVAYRAYCKACNVPPESAIEFKQMWADGKTTNHAATNYNYLDKEVVATINRVG